MRAKDLHMAATIDQESKTIMLSGAIDRNETTIVMRMAVPEPGLYTLIKAETNLTDSAWSAWQITLGEGVSLPLDNPTDLLMSRQFRKYKYIPERGAILFYDGEVRPGDAIFKRAQLQIDGPELVLSHNRFTTGLADAGELNEGEILRRGFGDEWPKIEVVVPVDIVEPGEIDIASFSAHLSQENQDKSHTLNA